jgi:hypothetical protein
LICLAPTTPASAATATAAGTANRDI